MRVAGLALLCALLTARPCGGARPGRGATPSRPCRQPLQSMSLLCSQVLLIDIPPPPIFRRATNCFQLQPS